MADRIVKIESKDLRLFTSRLKQFNSDIDTSTARLKAQFRQLGETWKDPQYIKFAQEFDQTMKNLQRFKQQSEVVIPHLVKLATHIDNTPSL